MNPIRLAQLSARIQERLASVLAHEMKDPRARFITVTRVKLATDMTQCAVYYSVLGDEKDRALVAHMLEHAKGFLERELRSALQTRVTPHLFFTFDESIEGAIRLGRKIDEVVAADRERALAQGREPGVDPATDGAAPAAADGGSPAVERVEGDEDDLPGKPLPEIENETPVSPPPRRKPRRR